MKSKPPGYRSAPAPRARYCGNCGAYGKTRYWCRMFGRRVGFRMVCDRWYRVGGKKPKP